MIIPNQEKPLPTPPELPSARPNQKERLLLSFSTHRSPSGAPPPYSAHELTPTVDLLSGEDPSPGPPISSPVGSMIPNLPKQNHLQIHRSDRTGLKETYVLDPSLPAPPGAPAENLSLYSKWGHVFATVYVVEGDLKGRVALDFGAKMGSVDVKIPTCPSNVPLQITATTHHHGNIFLLLPPKFNGPLVIAQQDGWAPRLLPSLKAVTRTLEEKDKTRRYWVGPWDGGEEWTGDECLVSTWHGHVWVGFWEEKEEKGWGLKKLWRF